MAINKTEQIYQQHIKFLPPSERLALIEIIARDLAMQNDQMTEKPKHNNIYSHNFRRFKMEKTILDRSVSDLTVDELRNIIRDIIREEGFTRWRTDSEGNRIFLSEDDYALYLAEHKNKFPSEVKAYYIDNQGFTVQYADELPTAKTRNRVNKARKEISEGKGLNLEEVKERRLFGVLCGNVE